MKNNHIKPRWHKVLVDFWENKARLALVIASIFIGVYAVGMIRVTSTILPVNLQTTYQNSIPANITIITDEFDQNLIDVITRVDGVALVDGRKTVSVRARVAGEDRWENLTLIAVNDPEKQQLKELTLQEGTFPSKEGNLLLLAEALNDFDVETGSLLEIQLQDDTIRTITVTGIVKDYTAGVENTMNRRIAFMDSDDLPYFHSSPEMNTLYVSVEGDSNDLTHVQEVAKDVQEKVKDTGRIIYSQRIQTSDQHPYGNYIDAVSVILNFVGILIVILGSFLVINTMNSIISEHTRQIGVMKLIGAQSRDIVKMYTVLVLLFGLVAFLIGVPAASFSAYLLSNQIATVLNGKLLTTNHFPIVPSAIVIQAVIAFLVPILAGILPILRGAKTSVQQALHSNLIEMKTENSRIDHLVDKVKEINGLLLLAMRNTFRRKGRLALTLITLSLGGSIFIGVFNVKAMLDEHINALANYCSADVFLTFNRTYPIDEIIPIAQQIDGVTYVEGWKTLTALLETEEQSEQVTIEAPPDDSQLLGALVQTGRWVRTDEDHTIVVNENFYQDFPDLKPGDSIILNVGGKDEAFTVVGIYNFTGLSDKRAYINYTTATELTGSWSKTNSFRLVTEDHSLNSILEMEDVVNETFRDRGYDVNTVASVQVIIDESGEKINLVIGVLLILAILTGLVGSIGLSGTLSLNVLERTSEIGVLRAIGAHDKAIAKLVIYEGLFTSLVSYIIGALVSFPVSIVLGNMVNQAIFKSEAILTINPSGFLIWFVLVIFMSITASLIPARNATKLTIREVLAYE
jgi:putative ABC transport system permease protein